MNTNFIFPYKLPAIKVEQPLGTFYVASVDANFLLEVSFSTPAKIIENKERGYGLIGGQREQSTQRLREIARYIDTSEAAFPNSIIIGANYHDDGQLEEDENKRWHVEQVDKDHFNIIVPSREKLASIIDGQHRLFAFNFSDRPSMPLLCSIYIDLPLPYHAYIFATINFNQKKVDKSLAYELFGFSVEEEPIESWAPETFAVYIARLLNTDNESPLYGNIMVGIDDSDSNIHKGSWAVSMATIVDGILKLISKNPKRDRDLMHKVTLFGGRNRNKLDDNEELPLRRLFINNNDTRIYEILSEYFTVIKTIFWSKASQRSYINKTVGVQALFDVLRTILSGMDDTKLISSELFKNKLAPASNIDYANSFFQASGKGRVRIKNIIFICSGILNYSSLRISDAERDEYKSVLQQYGMNI